MCRETLTEVTLWVCNQCGYWRQEKSTGVHQTSNPDDWRGRMVTHPLVPAQFVRLPAPSEGGDSQRKETEQSAAKTP